MNDAVRAWLEFSARELAAAEALQGDEYLASVVLFHAQQAVEKAFKAVIEHHGHAVPRIHSVRTLLQRVIEASGCREKPDSDDVLLLDQVYVDSRYPGSQGLLPGGMPTSCDAARALEAARRMTAFARRLLEMREGR